MYNGLATMPMMSTPGQVLALNLNGADGQCGLCCYPCNGTAAQISQQYAIPPEASAVYTLEEVNDVIRDVNDILQRTNLPMMPLMFMHFCIPFSPICCLFCASSQRQNRLKKYIELKNETLKSRNCHWELNNGTATVGRTIRGLGTFLTLIRHDMMSVAGAGQVQFAGASIGMPMMVPMQIATPVQMSTPGAVGPYGQQTLGAGPYSVGPQSAALYQQLRQPLGSNQPGYVQPGTGSLGITQSAYAQPIPGSLGNTQPGYPQPGAGSYSTVAQTIPDSTFFGNGK